MADLILRYLRFLLFNPKPMNQLHLIRIFSDQDVPRSR